MRELRNVYPNVDPRAVRFTEADWYKIESAGKQKLSAKQRERIWWISFLYVSLHNADPIDGGLIEERFQTIIDHAEALMRTLRMNTHITSVDYYVSTTLNKELMGEKWSQLDPLLTLTPLPPAWYALKDVIRAAKAALPKL
jgi:hypothetical protein